MIIIIESSTHPQKMVLDSVLTLEHWSHQKSFFRVQNSCWHFDHTCRQLFTEEMENAML